jgi:hypothetical protein
MFIRMDHALRRQRGSAARDPRPFKKEAEQFDDSVAGRDERPLVVWESHGAMADWNEVAGPLYVTQSSIHNGE